MQHGNSTPEGGVWEIDHGWDVVGADGQKIGDVADVQPNYITVSKGFIFKTDMYIPVSAISSVEGQCVYLSTSKDQIETQGWDRMPDSNETEWDRGVQTSGMTTGMADTSHTSHTSHMTDSSATRESMTDRDRLEVPVVEEQLSVGKREVEQGKVRVRKDVVEEEQRVNVPLRQEEVHVRRRPADGTTSHDVAANAFEDVDIEIPIRGEEAEVTKQAVVTEQVEIQKNVRERQEQVGDTVRREEVYVEGQDGVVVDDADSAGTTRTSHTSHTSSGKASKGMSDRAHDAADKLTDRP